MFNKKVLLVATLLTTVVYATQLWSLIPTWHEVGAIPPSIWFVHEFDVLSFDGRKYNIGFAQSVGVTASFAAHNGTVEYVYERAVAIFDIPPDVDNSYVQYYLFPWHFPPEYFYEYMVKDELVYLAFGLSAFVKFGDKPPYNFTLLEPYVSAPGIYAAEFRPTVASYVVSITWRVYYQGYRRLCVVMRDAQVAALKMPWENVTWTKCVVWPRPPRNITVAALEDGVYGYVDGRLVFALAKNYTPALLLSKTYDEVNKYMAELIERWKNPTPLYKKDNYVVYPLTPDLDIPWVNISGRPWLYTGPYEIESSVLASTVAGVSSSYSTVAVKPLGRYWLFIGNGSILSLPPYVQSYGDALNVDYGYIAAVATWDGVGVRVEPAPQPPPDEGWYFVRGLTKAVELGRDAVVVVDGVPVRVRALALLQPPCGDYVAVGEVVPASRYFGVANLTGLVALGNASVYCRYARVRVVLPNGTVVTATAEVGKVFNYTPPPYVYFGNGTRLAGPRPVAVAVPPGGLAVYANYSKREYLVAVEGPTGRLAEAWAYGNFTYPGAFLDLGNGTAYRVEPVSAAVRGPTTLRPRYVRLYRVVVESPWFRKEFWAPEGSRFSYTPPPLDLGNGTLAVFKPVETEVDRPLAVSAAYSFRYLVRVVLPNGTLEFWAPPGPFRYDPPPYVYFGNGTRLARPEPCVLAVAGPAACAVRYGAVEYWVEARSPAWRYANWTPAGAAVRPPPVVDLGNGTRLVDPSPSEVLVRGPVNATVSYRREYLVEVRGPSPWRGWASGCLLPNATVVNGVRYAPVGQCVEVRGPGVYQFRWLATYYAEFKDALGLPNPWASVRLCGRQFAADSAGRVYASAETDTACDLAVEAPPLGPYSLAVVIAIATVAAIATARRLTRRR